MKNYLLLITLVFFMFSCSDKSDQQESTAQETELEGPAFDPADSDEKAIALADSVIKAHGGMDAWNEKRYISWNFLGARDLVWDKYTGLVRIDFPNGSTKFIVNVNEDTGSVMIENKIITDPDSLAMLIDRGKQIWVNDSYWLIFPFKFKDPGVKLKYMGADTTLAGETAEVIALQFDSVGYTPQNKYMAYINPENFKILQWDYYQNASDTAATFSNLWSDYKDYDGIKLSAGRGERQLGNIKVTDTVQEGLFTQL
jgi:hypothetical protein